MILLDNSKWYSTLVDYAFKRDNPTNLNKSCLYVHTSMLIFHNFNLFINILPLRILMGTKSYNLRWNVDNPNYSLLHKAVATNEISVHLNEKTSIVLNICYDSWNNKNLYALKCMFGRAFKRDCCNHYDVWYCVSWFVTLDIVIGRFFRYSLFNIYNYYNDCEYVLVPFSPQLF